MTEYINSVRDQMHEHDVRKLFSLDEIVVDVIGVLGAKAKKEQVSLTFHPGNVRVYGTPLHFTQIVTNLVGNAIDAYHGVVTDERVVTVRLTRKDGEIVMTVQG